MTLSIKTRHTSRNKPAILSHRRSIERWTTISRLEWSGVERIVATRSETLLRCACCLVPIALCLLPCPAVSQQRYQQQQQVTVNKSAVRYQYRSCQRLPYRTCAFRGTVRYAYVQSIQITQHVQYSTVHE